MTIDEEIKSHFNSEAQRSFINIFYTANHFALKLNHILKPFSISQQQYNVLRILNGQFPKPASVNLITERMLDKASNASRLVEKLRLKGFIERIECPNDRRRVNVSITKKGIALLNELTPKVREIELKLTQFSDDELKTLNRMLDQFRQI
jgi:DNA-binding MarR family transcriptional regulator